MGAYINKQDILRRIDGKKLVQLTDDAGTGQVDDAVVNEAIAEAEGAIESRLRKRYTLPVPVTAQVKGLCLGIVVYLLFARRATTKDGILEVKKQGYDNAIKEVEAIGAGKAALDVPAAEETATNPASTDDVLRGSSNPVFTDDKMRNF
jgi:phage gp36-like protein